MAGIVTCTMTDREKGDATMIHSFDDRLAELRLSPFQEQAVRKMLKEAAALLDASEQTRRLEEHFVSEQRWREVALQIDIWAKKTLPPRITEALSTTMECILAMHRCMVQSGFQLLPPLPPPPISETELKQMMRDPRYWRDQDPEFVERVRAGFRKLYDERDNA